MKSEEEVTSSRLKAKQVNGFVRLSWTLLSLHFRLGLPAFLRGQPWATQKFLHHAAIQALPRERASFSQRPEDSTAEGCNT